MQDRNGQDSDYLVPGTWYLAPMPNFHTSNLNRAVFVLQSSRVMNGFRESRGSNPSISALRPYGPTALLPDCLIALPAAPPTASAIVGTLPSFILHLASCILHPTPKMEASDVAGTSGP
jgi:hypothetical protein